MVNDGTRAWRRRPHRAALAVLVLALGLSSGPPAQAYWSEQLPDDAPPEQRQFFEALDALAWVHGPTTVQLEGNASLQLPEGFVYLDKSNTDKYLELNQNVPDGTSVLVAPENLGWSAYLEFLDEGYVKDDEEIDADALLKSLQEATEAGNEERRKRGWQELHVVGWATPPTYNKDTRRLEWAARSRSVNGEGVNFFTKILGRRGHTSVQMVGDPAALKENESELNALLGDFTYGAGDSYADFKPGDKVAEYGLAAMVLGGAAAVATKKGFWGVLAGFFAAAWKFILAAAVAAGAWLKSLFRKKEG